MVWTLLRCWTFVIWCHKMKITILNGCCLWKITMTGCWMRVKITFHGVIWGWKSQWTGVVLVWNSPLNSTFIVDLGGTFFSIIGWLGGVLKWAQPSNRTKLPLSLVSTFGLEYFWSLVFLSITKQLQVLLLWKYAWICPNLRSLLHLLQALPDVCLGAGACHVYGFCSEEVSKWLVNGL